MGLIEFMTGPLPIRQERIAGSINRAIQIVRLPFFEKTLNSIQNRCSPIPLLLVIGQSEAKGIQGIFRVVRQILFLLQYRFHGGG